MQQKPINLIRNPDYKFDPRHSNDPEVYVPARQAYLAEVRRLGQEAREKNPDYLRYQRVIRMLGDCCD